MHTNEKREDPLVELGYEIRDVDYPKVRKAVIFFLSFAVMSGLIGTFIYTNRFTILHIEEPKPGINAVLPRHMPPAITPLIQDNVNSKTDIASFRQAETKKLTTTGYTDDTHQFAHIPIDRAMELVVKNGVKAPKTSGYQGGDLRGVSTGSPDGRESSPSGASPTTTPGATTNSNLDIQNNVPTQKVNPGQSTPGGAPSSGQPGQSAPGTAPTTGATTGN
jgi:hypothetical protein